MDVAMTWLWQHWIAVAMFAVAGASILRYVIYNR
jgi:hypothetical protein